MNIDSQRSSAYDFRRFFVDGRWIAPAGRSEADVINPATEASVGRILLGTAQDVDAAVAAARRAFCSYSNTAREERIELFEHIISVYVSQIPRLAQAVTEEMGAPADLATNAHAANGLRYLKVALEVLREFPFEERLGTTTILREPVGVCGLITPWNWPLNQICCKVAPALATGCTVVLKPSELSPLSAHVFAEILAEAGVPRGVFNLIDGDGSTVGEAISRHPDIDMVSFTGSTQAGVLVAKAAADTVKRVSQELGGKSANVILDDADIDEAVSGGVRWMMTNSGQSCNAPTRMLVPARYYEVAVDVAAATVRNINVGDPRIASTQMGPVANQAQFERIQRYIARGIEDGARLVAGGIGRPTGMRRGFFVRPTIFADVTNEMTIAREEIFGPVLVLIPYQTEEDAIRIANDSIYGLSAHVRSGNLERARRVARRLRTGMVHVNGAARDFRAPFGGYKRSGNGREWGAEGFREYLEIKSILGFG